MNLRLQYGGTFDPVHLGHLAIASAAHAAFGCTVHLMPAADPPHRPAPGATAEQRLALLRAAITDVPGLAIDARELARSGRSWTVDTLRELRAEFGEDAPIAILIGADSLLGLAGWREAGALTSLAHIVVAERPDSPIEALPAPVAALVEGRWADEPRQLGEAPSGLLFRLRQPLHDGAASDIRRRIASGEDWESQVPPAVAALVSDWNLYRGSGPVAPAGL